MKKLGQKLSFLTKVMLVIGLLISNLSSLSVVFAYEATEDMVVTLNEKLLEISYNQELADEVKAVEIRVYENYTYSNGKSENEVPSVHSLTEEELLSAKEGNLELSYDSIFVNEGEEVKNVELFDGLYKVKVEIVDVTDYTEEVLEVATESDDVLEQILPIQEEVTETVIAVATYEKEMIHESGLNIRLFNSDLTEISLVDGKYSVSRDNSKVSVVAQILSGGLNPTDMFEYNGEEFFAADLVKIEFKSEKDFNGYLFGEYELPVEVKVNKVLLGNETSTTEEVVYTDSVNVLYETYELNADGLNSVANSMEYGEVYTFSGDSKNGNLYVLPEFGEVSATIEETVVTRTMLDLYKMLNSVFTNEGEIKFSLIKNGVNVLESYTPANEEDTLEKYLSTITLDETVQVFLSNDGLTITYDVVFVADLNSDKVITKDDVLELINHVVGMTEETDSAKFDVYGEDSEVNSLDVLYLNQIVKTHAWDVKFVEEEVSLNASLIAKLNGEVLSEDNKLTSGDEFTVDYVLSLTDYEVNGVAGLFNYDKSLFELISLEVMNEWFGNNNDDKFIYLGEKSLTGPELEENPEVETVEENTTDTVVTEDYVVVSATFKALKSTANESSNIITLKEIELFNSNDDNVTYYVLDKNEVSTDVINVVASEDNTLSYLEIAGVEIVLQEGVFEYEITVSNDVTVADLKYILGNVAANVTSIVCPEELVEGENKIVVTVTSESGVSQDYTIKVIREEAPEETTTQVNYTNNYEDDSNNKDEEVVVTPGEDDSEDDEKVDEESNLSRIIIIILILLVIAGLVYLIFRDEEDEETKKANKEINKLKKEVKEPEVKTIVNKNVDKSNSKNTSNNKSNSKNNNISRNKKK